jgi:hypothetical protein
MAGPAIEDLSCPGSAQYPTYTEYSPHERILGDDELKKIAEDIHYLSLAQGQHQIIYDVHRPQYGYQAVFSDGATQTMAYYRIYRHAKKGMPNDVRGYLCCARLFAAGGTAAIRIVGGGVTVNVNIAVNDDWQYLSFALANPTWAAGWNTITVSAVFAGGPAAGDLIFLKSIGAWWDVDSYVSGTLDGFNQAGDLDQSQWWLDLSAWGDQAPVSVSQVHCANRRLEEWYAYYWQGEPLLTFSEDWTCVGLGKGYSPRWQVSTADGMWYRDGDSTSGWRRMYAIPWKPPPGCTQLRVSFYMVATSNASLWIGSLSDPDGFTSSTTGAWVDGVLGVDPHLPDGELISICMQSDALAYVNTLCICPAEKTLGTP